METVVNQNLARETNVSLSQSFSPLEQITRSHIPTDQAAYYLSRKPQTLRGWACFEHGLIKPIRVNGRLAWPVAEIKKVLHLPV